MNQSNSNNSSKNKMTKEAASRIQSAADKNPDSSTSKSGFKQRAQSAANRKNS
ncbi:MAG: hypothetical protein ACFBSE_18505 [Prochloraceae cyanobacterium]